MGEMDNTCNYCGAMTLPEEPAGFCCSSGKARVESVCPPPPEYAVYYDRDNDVHRHFTNKLRLYNGVFQMTSFGVSGRTSDHGDGFQSTFRIQGQVYPRLGSLLPPQESHPAFLQIYFIGDLEAQVNQRCSIFGANRQQGLRVPIVRLFQDFLHANNLLIRTFKFNLERMPTDECRIVIRADMTPVGEHAPTGACSMHLYKMKSLPYSSMQILHGVT